MDRQTYIYITHKCDFMYIDRVFQNSALLKYMSDKIEFQRLPLHSEGNKERLYNVILFYLTYNSHVLVSNR